MASLHNNVPNPTASDQHAFADDAGTRLPMTSLTYDDITIINTTINNTTMSELSAGAQYWVDLRAMMWKVVPPVLLLLGTLGNVMIVVVMRGIRRQSPTSACLTLYFTALALSDQCALLATLLLIWIRITFSWPPEFYRYHLLCIVPKFLWNVCGVASVYFLLAMTYERVLSVLAPHKVHVLCTARRAKMVIAGILLFALAFSQTYLYTWVYWPQLDRCQFRPRYMHLLPLFEWLELIVCAIIPFVLLITGNVILIWQVARSSRLSRQLRAAAASATSSTSQQGEKQKQESGDGKVNSMTITLILTSIGFLILTMPVCLADVAVQNIITYSADRELAAMLGFWRSVCSVMWCSSFATNFYIYMLSGSKFRSEMKKYVFCCKK